MQLQGYKGNRSEEIKASLWKEMNGGKAAKVYTAEGVAGQTEGLG